jgi:hypothetical protein
MDSEQVDILFGKKYPIYEEDDWDFDDDYKEED